MNVTKLSYDNIPQLSKTDKAYISGDSLLREFYEYDCDLEQFEQVIKRKAFSDRQRNILVDEIELQYENIDTSDATLQNIRKLRQNNCYTVITAHQPNLFTGPLYLIYKIFSAINLVEQLNKRYPDNQFVPVFWTGGEDHDFDEVNFLNLFGKKIVWEDRQGGPVGLYNVDSLVPVIDEVLNILGQGEHAVIIADKLKEFYTEVHNYSNGVRGFLNWIFRDYGLIIANGNSKIFKEQMIPVFRDELLNQTSKNIVEKTLQKIQAAGFRKQAHAREINLFYLSSYKRSRIVKENNLYKVLDTDLTFSSQEILEELKQNPQNFSPNVILRPLFQETIFPNLAYIGGGGESAYWFERKEQFDHYNLAFPMLIRRCSVLWIDKNSSDRMMKFGIAIKDIFSDTEKLIKNYIVENAQETLSLRKEKEALMLVFEQIMLKATGVDPSLDKVVVAQQVQILKTIEKLEQRLLRTEKKKNETTIAQIQRLKGKLFPNNSLQERHDNFLAYYCRYGNLFLDTLKANLYPLEKKFTVISD